MRIRCFNLSVFLAAIGCLFFARSYASPVRIAEGGRALAVILLPDNAGDTEEFAASELQAYIEKITGAKLPVKPESELGESSFISVGRTRLAAPAREKLAGDMLDAFIVETTENGVILAGPGDTGRAPGTLFAVYDFLEREMGCRWLAPGELWEHVPRVPSLEVDAVNRVERPAFRYRQDSTFSMEGSWGIKNKANLGRVKWPFDWISERLRGTDRAPFDVPGWSGVHSGTYDLLPVAHRSADLELRERMLKEHPEWFALQSDGSRRPDWFCHSNPDVVELMADRLSQMLKLRPHKEFVQLGDGDSLSRGACQCDDCLDLDAAGASACETLRGRHTYRWLHYANRVAARLAETDPGRFLLIPAYETYQEPPDPEIIRPAENVMIDYYTWSGCRIHGYEYDGTYDGVPVGTMPEMESHELYRDWIERWHAQTPAGMIMAEYLSRNAMDRITGAQPRRYVRDTRYLRDHGFVGYRAFVNANSWGLFGINRYAVMKALWNPDLDEEDLVRDFCDHAFHEASEPMQRFIDTIESAMESAPCSHVLAISWTTPDVLAEARGHLNAAHAAAADNELVRQRLVPWEIHFRYASMAGPAWTKMYRALHSGHLGIDPDAAVLREALDEGQAAIDYLDEMRRKYRRHPDFNFIRAIGFRMRGNVREDSAMRQRLAAMEEEAAGN